MIRFFSFTLVVAFFVATLAVADPPVPGDGRGLDDHQRHPACRPAAQVDQVPVVRQPVPGDYWHMGDITIRLRNIIPRIASGLSRSISGTSRSWSDPAGQPWAGGFCGWSEG